MNIGFVSFSLRQFTLDGYSIFPLPATAADIKNFRLPENVILFTDADELTLWAHPLSDYYNVKPRDYWTCYRYIEIDTVDKLLQTYSDVYFWLNAITKYFGDVPFGLFERASLALRQAGVFQIIHETANELLPFEPAPFLPDFRVTFKRETVFRRDNLAADCAILFKNSRDRIANIRFPSGTIERIRHPDFFTPANILACNAPVWVNVSGINPNKEQKRLFQAACKNAFIKYWHTTPFLREWLTWTESTTLNQIARFQINNGARATRWSNEKMSDWDWIADSKPSQDDFLNAVFNATVCSAIAEMDDSLPVISNNLAFTGLYQSHIQQQTLSLAVFLSKQQLDIQIVRVTDFGVFFRRPNKNTDKFAECKLLLRNLADHNPIMVIY